MGRTSKTKEKLINSAIELISTRSYNSVGVQEICEHAGVKKGSFYHFFPSKRDLTLAALDYMWGFFREKILEPTFNIDLPLQERFHKFIDTSYKYHSLTKESIGCMLGCHVGNLAVELSTQDEVIREKIEHIFKEWAEYCERLIGKAIASGELPVDIDSLATAQAILAYIEGLLLLGKSYNDPSLIKRLGVGVVQLAIKRNGSESHKLTEK
ncbi:MAG: TetR/AcrR family transcriptional regulator [Candidatus Dadabacteria bacterium]|nr:TetR/AcrR family transcriptional regulator [Candidatus Dadabacteria bacterium]